MSVADNDRMPPPTISLSMMRFENGPLMSVEDSHAAGAVVCNHAQPAEVDLMLSMVCEPEPIALDDYRTHEPARLAG